MAFLTGSYAYGKPTHRSDIDLVVLVSKKDLDTLCQIGKCDESMNEEYQAAGGTSIRFGNLNLLVCTSRAMFDCWLKGTQQLKKQAPVDRDFACQTMTRFRKKAGFHVPDYVPQEKDESSEEDEIPF